MKRSRRLLPTSSTDSFACSTIKLFIIYNFFTTPVIQNILTSIHKHSPITAIDQNSSASGIICIIPIPALPIPLNDLIIIKSEGSFHGIIHFPTILRKMSFCCLHIYAQRKIHLQCPSRYIQFVGGIIPRLCCTVIPRSEERRVGKERERRWATAHCTREVG